MPISRIKAGCDFIQFVAYPEPLSFKDAKAGKYEVLLACIMCGAGLI